MENLSNDIPSLGIGTLNDTGLKYLKAGFFPFKLSTQSSPYRRPSVFHCCLWCLGYRNSAI